MTIWIAILLGLVQGITEFLPVSSSGHLVLLENIFGIQNNIILFDVILHVATLLAVVIVYRKSILELIKHPFSDKMQKLVFATLPTLIIALIFKNFFENSFSGNLLPLGFFITAIFLIIAQIVSQKEYQYRTLSFGNAIVAGMFQGLAIMPGISRSGSTITSLIVQGVRREQSAEFSFLLSIPIILASLLYECLKLKTTTVTIPISCFVIAFLVALVCGILSIKLMLKVVKKAKYWGFSAYLLILTTFLLLNQFVFKLF